MDLNAEQKRSSGVIGTGKEPLNTLNTLNPIMWDWNDKGLQQLKNLSKIINQNHQYNPVWEHLKQGRAKEIMVFSSSMGSYWLKCMFLLLRLTLKFLTADDQSVVFNQNRFNILQETWKVAVPTRGDWRSEDAPFTLGGSLDVCCSKVCGISWVGLPGVQ